MLLINNIKNHSRTQKLLNLIVYMQGGFTAEHMCLQSPEHMAKVRSTVCGMHMVITMVIAQNRLALKLSSMTADTQYIEMYQLYIRNSYLVWQFISIFQIVLLSYNV